MFEFKHVKNFEQHMVNSATPMVLFATPGMMNTGTSLSIFKEWCGDERNTLIIPGYCSPGSVGSKVLNMKKKIEIDKKMYNVNCKVMSMSFSAHVDSKGIMEFLTYLNPSNIVLVHGDNEGMLDLKKKVSEVLKINCLNPENHSITTIPIIRKIPFKISLNLLNYYYANSLLSENNFVIPNVILSDFGRKHKKALLQTSAEFVHNQYLKLKENQKKSAEEEKVSNEEVKVNIDQDDELEMLISKNTRYCRARVLIKWTQEFHWKSDEEKFKTEIKDVIMNKKLTSIPDRNRLSAKLDLVIDSYVTIKLRDGVNEETDIVEEETENLSVEVSYNILERTLGEIIISSIKAVFIRQG
jgi:hypothetical protein